MPLYYNKRLQDLDVSNGTVTMLTKNKTKIVIFMPHINDNIFTSLYLG